jgi:hypothetical protein
MNRSARSHDPSKVLTPHDLRLDDFLSGTPNSFLALQHPRGLILSDGSRTNKRDRTRTRWSPDHVFRIPKRLDADEHCFVGTTGRPPHGPRPQTSRGTGSSGSVDPECPDQRVLFDDGCRHARRRGVPIEVDAKNPPLEREHTGGRRRPLSRRSTIGTRGVLRRRGTGGNGRGITGRTLPPRCPQRKPHPRLPRSGSSRVGETGSARAPRLRPLHARAHRRRVTTSGSAGRPRGSRA